MSEPLTADNNLDLEEELEQRGDDLSLRAARYIRIKRTTESELRKGLRHMCARSLEWEKESHE